MADNENTVGEPPFETADSAQSDENGADGQRTIRSGDQTTPVDGTTSDDKTPADDKTKTRGRITVSISARGLLLTLLIVILASAVTIFGWLYTDARSELDAQARTAENNARAEKIALDYAVNAATMDFKDLSGWRAKLVAGTSPELNDKLSQAATSMEQILVPLEWTSTAEPLVAKVRSDVGGAYVVDCFVSVQTKTVQAPEALQSTATYSVVVDSNKDWQITDVGGIGAVVGQQ